MTKINRSHPGKPELLAPAGSVEAFFAAVDSGADAVYAGLRNFSARSRARNFAMDEIARMSSVSRREGRRLYVTLNTLVKDCELPEIVAILSDLEAAGVDALIVQDLGLARIARLHFPSLPLHASTQATIHNLDGVRRMAALGFRRVVLARELSLPEIRAVVAGSPVEIECFIHGALCFCISGQCLFSSHAGGRSGNRGDCAQPCRRRFRIDGEDSYPFSTRDLWGLDAVAGLAASGVSCLKIEGRMKPAGYVAAAVAAYRKVIDAPADCRADAVREAEEILSKSRGRDRTAGYLVEGAPDGITRPSSQGAVGQLLGRVEVAGASGITFVTSARIHAGDRIRVQPGNDREGRAFTVRSVRIAGEEKKGARPGTRVTVSSPFRFEAGDSVFRIADGADGNAGEAACNRRLAAVPPERISCNVALAYAEGTLTVSGATDEFSFGLDFPVGPLDAARSGGASEALRARFSETGETPFALSGFDAGTAAGRFLPPSRLKEIRRDFYDAFGRAAVGRRDAARAETREAALRSLDLPRAAGVPGPPKLWIGVATPEEASAAGREGVAGFLLPIACGMRGGGAFSVPEIGVDPGRIVWRLPFWIPEGDSAAVRDAVEALLSAGHRNFEANNPSHLEMLSGRGARITAGWRLGIMNSQALVSLHEQGVSSAILSPEDDADNLEALLRAELPVERWVPLQGTIPLMVSRIPVVPAGEMRSVSAEGGAFFEIRNEGGLTVLRSSKPHTFEPHRERLEAAGCAAFVVERSGKADPR